MKKYILISEKSWHKALFDELSKRQNEQWFYITTKEKFNDTELQHITPDKIFIPHWSYIISESIYSKHECIVFHMTDLPFGRGGSPLQNLIVKGFQHTQISALKVDKGIDTGPVYCKEPLDLSGTANEIFIRSVPVIFKMIINIIEKNIEPLPQNGQVEVFKRRTPDQSDIKDLNDINTIYNYIRMLDGENYPPAFLETENIRMEFFDAQINNNEIKAHVRIIKK